jgi:hypothetical protein
MKHLGSSDYQYLLLPFTPPDLSTSTPPAITNRMERPISVRLLKSYSSCRLTNYTSWNILQKSLAPVINCSRSYYTWLFGMIKLHNDACDVVHAFPRVGQFRQLHSRSLRFIFRFQYGNSILVDKRI